MDPRPFANEAEVERALRADRFLVFKHSRICPVSDRAFREYRAFLDAAPVTPTAWIDVIGQRPWSQRVAAETGVRHESPQAILVLDGRAVWNASHGAITRETLEAALDAVNALEETSGAPRDPR